MKEPTPPKSRRPSSRRPIARLDATTYRPQLKPGTGPLAATLDSSPHTSLHRRADNYSSATAQLINQEKDQNQKHQDQQSNSGVAQPHYQYKQEIIAQDQQTTTHNQGRQQQQSQTVPTQNAQNQFAQNQNHQAPEPQTQNQYYQQEKSQEIYQEHYQEPEYQPQRYLNPYYQPRVYQNQNPYYQPQTFDQRAYEQRAFELLNHRQYQPLAQPLQYRLVPYNTGTY